MSSKAQIVATLGPASSSPETFTAMAEHCADVVRLNFSWGSLAEKASLIDMVRDTEKKLGRRIPIIADLPGARVQTGASHSFDKSLPFLSDKDIESIKFCAQKGVEYFALSFVGSAKDIEEARAIVKEAGGSQRLIAKIERPEALDNLDSIIEVSDAVLIARGDLGEELGLEAVPFAQARIIDLCRKAGKPVITATEMMLSMKENPRPTRAEVSDVSNAILQGSDAVMLSEESAIGKYPVETVAEMEKIVAETEKHVSHTINPL